MASDALIYLLQVLGLLTNQRQSLLNSYAKDRVLANRDRFKSANFSFSRGHDASNSILMCSFVTSSSDFNFRIDNIERKLFFTVQSALPDKLYNWFLQKQKIQSQRLSHS